MVTEALTMLDITHSSQNVRNDGALVGVLI
jgi:hypothetical protein